MAQYLTGDCAMNTKQREQAWKAFRNLWVAGTVGGFLAALMRSIPLDAMTLAHPPSCGFVIDLFLRYAYLSWFIVYFLISNLGDDKIKKGDVAFDIIQSLSSFAAAFALGIAVRGEGFQFDRSSDAFAFANGAILAICFFSLVFFIPRDHWRPQYKLHLLRIGGAITAATGLMVSWTNSLSPARLLALAATQLILWALLYQFGRMRINALPAE
jgi:hypothetical protein